ncbi:MAG: phosphopantetheine adenylyltransferase [Kordiimonas sp.]
MLKLLVTMLLLLVGAINFAPILGVLGPSSLERLYSVNGFTPDVLMLLRHRAILLAIVGGFLLVSALRVSYRTPASVCAYVSMTSYILIFGASDVENQALIKIYQIDTVAIALLIVANVIDWQAWKRVRLPTKVF